MEGFVDLSAEFRRISESPYIPSLQRLHDLLQHVDACLLQRWARANACRIDCLAATILEGLELWPYALEILGILACIPSFRDAVLRQKPMLLDTLLSKAVGSESGFDKYSTPCSSLLSLPLDIAIPSTFPVFLTGLVEKAVCTLSPATIRPIYHVLSAVGSSYLDALPIDVLTHLQDRLVEVLTKLDMDDHFGDLLCLGVLAKFACRSRNSAVTAQLNNVGSPPGEGGPTTADRYVSARKLFEVKRAPKTLDLAVIRAITACSESCTLSPNEISEKMGRKNSGKVKKLNKKILRADIDPDVQCAALNFVVALSPGQRLPQELVPVFQQLLLTSSRITLSARAISQYILQLDQSTICDTLLQLLRLACDDKNISNETLSQIGSAQHIIDIITVTSSTSSSFQEAVVWSISSSTVKNVLQHFATHIPTHLNPVHGHGLMDVCPTVCIKALNQLHQSLGVMILSAALHASPSGIHTQLIPLLEKQTKLSDTQSMSRGCCLRKPSRGTQRVSLFEASSTPQTDSISHDWRNELVHEMSRDAGSRYESVVRIVSEVCKDLELRCEDAERPLRKEQTKSEELRVRLETSQNRVAELEFQARDRSTELHRLMNERDGLADQTRTQKEHLKDLWTSLEQLRQDFDLAKASAESAAQTATENARQQDLAYLATLTGKDEIFEEQAVELAASVERANVFESDVARLRSQAASDMETLNTQRSRIDELNNAIAHANTLAASKQAENYRLLESERKLVASRDNAAAKARDESERHESLINVMKKELELAQDETSELQHELDKRVRANDAEIIRLKQFFHSSNEQWQAKLEEAVNSAALADKQHTLMIADLRLKIKRIRKERDEKAKHLGEFEDISSRLVAMSKEKKAFDDTGLTSPRQEDEIISSSWRSNQDPQECAVDPARSSGSSSSSTNGPTPKRAKRRRASQSASTKSVTTARANVRGAVRRSRAPLADLAPMQNRGLETPVQRVPQFDANTKEVSSDNLQENSARLDSDD
ncbi:hypothetical protein N7G274_004005 [Stereocaulon virgatum]|uniref:Uncharacterized protein n=1 Tax=Stereocaulon virgatum TaxID=373712 RepID=A0ABR4AED6_9LECA